MGSGLDITIFFIAHHIPPFWAVRFIIPSRFGLDFVRHGIFQLKKLSGSTSHVNSGFPYNSPRVCLIPPLFILPPYRKHRIIRCMPYAGEDVIARSAVEPVCWFLVLTVPSANWKYSMPPAT
jgi:hypothetical protein